MRITPFIDFFREKSYDQPVMMQLIESSQRLAQRRARVAQEIQKIEFDLFEIATESPGFAFESAPIDDPEEFTRLTRGLSFVSKAPYLAQGGARQIICSEIFYFDYHTGQRYYKISQRYPGEIEPFLIMRGEVTDYRNDLD